MTDVICVVNKNKLLEQELKGCVLLLVLNCKRFQKRLAKGLKHCESFSKYFQVPEHVFPTLWCMTAQFYSNSQQSIHT